MVYHGVFFGMSLPRYAARVDENQKDIVEALRKIGCDVLVLGRPVDLLVGWRAHNYLLECKSGRSYTGTLEQREWIKNWKGQVRVVQSPQEAVEVVTQAYGGLAG